jgi:ribosome-binding factor A
MALSHRVERIAEQIREELSQMLATEVSDPRIGLVTITRVKVTGDLSLARAYWTIIGDRAERDRTGKALARAAPYVRHLLSGRMSLRRVPEVQFLFDEATAAQERVEEILAELQAEKQAREVRGELSPGEPDAPTAPDDTTPPPASEPDEPS